LTERILITKLLFSFKFHGISNVIFEQKHVRAKIGIWALFPYMSVPTHNMRILPREMLTRFNLPVLYPPHFIFRKMGEGKYSLVPLTRGLVKLNELPKMLF
jgi:hypothetical protein